MIALGEVAEFEMGQAPPGNECNTEGIGTLFVKAGEFADPYPLQREWTTKPLKYGKRGDVFICVVGATAGKLNLGIDCAIGRSVAAIRPSSRLDTRYLYFQLQPWVMKLRAASVGSAQGVINKMQLSEIPIYLPDLGEQRRIVSDVEKEFSRLDKAVSNLQRVKANLRRFEKAVLSAAVDGSLAAPLGRRVHELPLMQRLLAAHRNAWKKEGKYIPPAPVAPDDLPSLPKGWDWGPLGLLGKDPFQTVQTGPFGAQLHNTDFRESGVPVIAVGNLTGTGFRRDNLYFVDAPKAAQLSRYDVWAGDLLFARSGATLGKVCVAPADVADWRMTGHILRARLNTEFILPDVAVYALAAMPAVRKQVFGNVRGVTRPGFNTSLLESIWLPVPPLDEQQRIVAEVDRRLSIVRGVEAEVDANLKRAQALRQAVLAQAFGGA